MINYKFNSKTGILETTVKGETSIDDLINYITTLSEDKYLPRILKILTDATEGRFPRNVEPEDLNKIVEANNNHLSLRDMICDAFIVSSSMEVALGQLYMQFSKKINYYFNVFSTKQAALNWLKNF